MSDPTPAPVPIMSREPVRVITGGVLAFLALLSAFGVTLTEPQRQALGTFLPYVLILLLPLGAGLGEFIRAKVFSPATVSKLQANPPPFPTPSPDTAPPVATTDETPPIRDA